LVVEVTWVVDWLVGSGLECVVRVPDAAGAPEVVEQASELAGDRDPCAGLVALGATSSDPFSIAPQVAVTAERPEDVRGRVH
jgi:hypothetical protein